MKNFLPTLLLILIFIFGCGRGEGNKKNAPDLSKATEAANAATTPASSAKAVVRLTKISQPAEDKLMITYSDDEQVSFDCEGSCEYLLSPNRRALALNTVLLSNLAIAEIYRIGPDGKIDFEQAENLSAKVWSLIEMMHQLEVEDILRPRTAVMGWDSDTVIEVLVTGDTETGVVIDEVVRVEVNESNF